MSNFDYTSNEVPAWYRCRECGAHGVKLFRLAFARQAATLCFDCCYLEIDAIDTTAHPGRDRRDCQLQYSDADANEMKMLGRRCPAIPLYTDDDVTAGLYAFKDVQIAWWRRIPLRKAAP